MPRKSPHKHKVKEHTRQGRPVKSYMRGKGKKPSKSLRKKAKKVVVGKKRGNLESAFSSFNVSIIYPDGKREKDSLQANTFEVALDRALQSRTRVDEPKNIRIRGIK